MKKLLFPTMLAGSLMVSGCAAGLGGNPIGGILGSVLGGGAGSQNNTGDFERAAANACGQEASRYGRVNITSARLSSRDTVRVDGTVQTNDRYQRRFTCSFRSDGRIVDFGIE